ncbi:DUF202 domain-containing protein [Streptomyces sp. NBC_00443]|uniref:DUF202 domain-containing protein n=1 Tax=Streptomyces sp. NBC_00443 TaxID=2975743 RepID=UPI003FA74A70
MCPSPGTDRPRAAHRRTAVRGGRSRTTLANQRTLLAWFRPALALLAASFAVVRLTRITPRAHTCAEAPTVVPWPTPVSTPRRPR